MSMKRSLAAAIALTLSSSVMAEDPMKIGFVYVGPIGDHGWSYQLDGQLYKAPYMEAVEGFDPALCALPEFKLEEWFLSCVKELKQICRSENIPTKSIPKSAKPKPAALKP